MGALSRSNANVIARDNAVYAKTLKGMRSSSPQRISTTLTNTLAMIPTSRNTIQEGK